MNEGEAAVRYGHGQLTLIPTVIDSAVSEGCNCLLYGVTMMLYILASYW